VQQKTALEALSQRQVEEKVQSSKVYFMGDDELKTVLKFDLLSHSWSLVEEHPLEEVLLAYQKALGLGDGKSVLITGGKNFNTKEGSPAVNLWDTEANTLKNMCPMLSARHKHALVRLDDYVYAMGGIGQNGKTTD
jgi:hypothetical protein